LASPNQKAISSDLLIGVLLAIIFTGAFLLRVVPPHNFVFSTDPIRFTGVDAYFYMRQVDSLVHNFPSALSFDPYLRFNWGMDLGLPHIFVLIMGTITWLLTLGNASQAATDSIAVYLPAVFGALTIVPVFFIARAMLNKWAGLIAAAVMAVMPGEFLGRSILGFADRHVLDNLLIASCLMFYLLAFRSNRERDFNLKTIFEGGWRRQFRPISYAALAGVFMGLFMLDWKGSVLFLLVVAAYVAFQTFINHLRALPSEHIWIVSTTSAIVAGAIALPFNPSPAYYVPLLLALFTGPVLGALSRIFNRARTHHYLFPAVTGGLALLTALILWFSAPNLFEPIIGSMNLFSTKDTEFTVLEMQPILMPGGKLSGDVVWGNFTTGIFFALIGILVMAWRLATKRDVAEALFFLIWTVLVLTATIFARRFAQILAPNVSVLVGYCCALALYFFKLAPAKGETISPSRKKNSRAGSGGSALGGKILRICLVVVVVFFAAVFPNIGPSSEIAAQPAFAPDEGWMDALTWLKSNTPEPLGYDSYYNQPATGFKYPASSYSVISWWDYGYWIVRIGHRMPFCDPGGGGRESVAKFLVATDEQTGSKYSSSMGSRYAVIDSATAIGKYHAVLTYAQKPQSQYFEDFTLRDKDGVRRITIWYPDYYRTMTARLYNFDAKAATATRIIAVGYADRTGTGGSPREIVASQIFSRYEDASAWVAAQKGGKYVIGSDDPFSSPVSLPALSGYKLIHGSSQSISIGDKRTVPAVKVFECLPQS
jgi:dolichyl-diphosphooligosaccharide--protein glycosyltransferase